MVLGGMQQMPELSDVYVGRILIVDDNPVNIAVIKKILSNEGYSQVEATCKPVKVAQMYSKHPYDLVLLDVHMPEMNGLEVMAKLKQEHPKDYLPIVMLTADDNEE